MRQATLLIAISIFLTMSLSAVKAAEPERPAAIDGSSYTVIAPVYDGSAGVMSHLRLYNGGTTTSTFSVTVVSANNGLTLGAASIQVPANASPQYPLTSAGGPNSIFAQAGVGASGGSYALYIQNSNALAGYQHVTYNSATTLFENNSVCITPMNQQRASTFQQVLTNVHTSTLAAYPSILSFHNYTATATTIALAAYDAVTGALVGVITQPISANGTLSLAESQLETLYNFHPTSSQAHINVVIGTPTGLAPTVRATQTIRNSQLGGDINMAESCALNAVAPTVVQVPITPTTPTAYCGTITWAFPYNFIPTYFTASVATNGRMEGTLFGVSGTYWVGASFVGTLSGTSYVASTVPSGGSAVGTVQNGSMSGTAVDSSTGVAGTISGSQNACSS